MKKRILGGVKAFIINTSVILSAVFIILGNTISFAQAVPVSGLVTRFTFDNANLNWNSSTAEIIDSVGSLTGDAVGSTSAGVVPGQIGEALNLKGTQFVASPAVTPLVAYNTNYTVSAWIYIPDTGNGINSTIVAKASNASKEMSFFYNTTRRLSAFVGGNSITGNAIVPLNQWTHVALTNNDVTNQYSIYINGALDKTGTSGTTVSTGIDFLMGARRNNSNADSNIRFVGRLDDVRIYNRALNTTELTAIATLNDLSDPGSNNAPVASAGIDQAIQLPTSSVSLTGSATDSDGTIASYAWSKVSGGSATITTPSSASTTVTGLTEGVYFFRLTATDDDGATDIDDMEVAVTTTPPTCPAKKIVVLGSSSAAGTGASPSSNSWVNLLLAYLAQSNPLNTITNYGTSGFTTYHALPTGTSIPVGRPDADVNKNMTKALSLNPNAIIINLPTNDTASGYPVSEQQENFKLLFNTALDANVPVWVTTTQPRNLGLTQRNELISMRDWIQTNFPSRSLDFWSTIANTDGTINTTYSAGDGIHVNNAGHSILSQRVQSSNLMSVLCSESPINAVPTVNAGTDASINTTSANLTGSASDTDGSIVSYSWSKLSGGSATISSPNTASTTVTGLAVGSYTFRLTAIDDDGRSVNDDINITVTPANNPPVISSLVTSSITLTSSSSDTDGSIVSYAWSKVSGGSANIVSPSSSDTVINGLTSGVYIFRLTVTDDLGAPTSSDIQVTI